MFRQQDAILRVLKHKGIHKVYTFHFVIYNYNSLSTLMLGIVLSRSMSSHILRPAHIYNRTQQSPTLRLCSAS
jgi:hypothetical protein